MPDEGQLDIEALVAPISEAQPCGSNYDTREDKALVPLFSQLNSLSSLARSYEKARYQNLLSNLSGAGGAAPPEWSKIHDLAREILTKHSKDTRALIALVEAQGHLFGLPGLRWAFAACIALVEKYNTTLYPAPDEGESAYYSLEKLGQLCSSEAYHLQSAMFSASIFSHQPGYSRIGFLSAERLQKVLQSEKDEKKRDQLIQESPMTTENFLLRLNDVKDRREFSAFDNLIESVLVVARQLDKLLAAVSDNTVGIRRIVDDLTTLQKWYKDLIHPFWEKLPEVIANPTAVSESSAGESKVDQPANQTGSNVNSATVMATAVANREQAFASLRQVANFFRTTEPHSPVSYALEQAVRWGRMPLPELLKEIIDDKGTLDGLYQRMGIQEKDDK